MEKINMNQEILTVGTIAVLGLISLAAFLIAYWKYINYRQSILNGDGEATIQLFQTIVIGSVAIFGSAFFVYSLISIA